MSNLITTATLFNKILLNGTPPATWGESIIKLFHKKGPATDPTNFRPIALSNTVAKTFHLILSHRTTKFLTENKLIDPSIQKAFLPGVSGCTEHNCVMSETIKHIKHMKKTLHITFFDLADAFGSVPHDIILMALKRNHFPQEVQEYFKNFYSQIKSKVTTKSFHTDAFSFKKGVTQGDPMSAIIFILAFQPIIDNLVKNEHFGVLINEKRVITLPYADDFCLMTTDMRVHKRLISEIHSYINSMGMSLKPAKCRSFSLVKGKPTVVDFHIGDNLVPSILHEEQKFLGKVQFFHGKSQNTLDHIKDSFKEKLDNIENLMIRSEQKMWIYQNYFIPSIRFLLTVHELTQTHVKVLDAFTHVYLKKWTGLPPSATNIVLHMKVGLDIPTIETLYNICHTLTHTAMRQKGDSTVNAVIDNSISRESQWTQKRSTVVACQEVYDHAISLHPLPLDDSVKERIKLAQGMKASVTKKCILTVTRSRRNI